MRSQIGFAINVLRMRQLLQAHRQRKLFALWCAIALCLFTLPRQATAQCANSANLSCQVYNTCFDRYCTCSGSSNYFITYGRKYCDRFLNATGLSAAGKTWRDKTLLCLQEAIVPKLPIDAPATCNCAEMKDFAFRSHVECYTQSAASVCRLPLADWAKIAQIIDSADLFDRYGASQILDVVNKCFSDYSDQVGSDIRSKVDAGQGEARELSCQLKPEARRTKFSFKN